MPESFRIKNYDKLKRVTNNTEVLWKNARGIAPDSVADKMDAAMLKWITELTNALEIWLQKGIDLTDGELILARTNIGSLTECWLKFFYCAFYEDYLTNPKLSKGKIVEPNKMSFEDLKTFSIGILWDDDQDDYYKWVDKIQHQRNSIHAFNYRDIGTALEFLEDVDILYEFVDLIEMRLPPLEDCIDAYPAGYQFKSSDDSGLLF